MVISAYIIINRYGLALRDHDIDVIRARNMAVVNRYPLMDVSYCFINIYIAFRSQKCIVRHIEPTLTLLSRRFRFYSCFFSSAR